jgi:diguanylate cyclase
MKILIAEDDPAIRHNVRRLLQAEGFEVLLADNGAEALVLAREQLPELVLSDVSMPQLDGLQLLAALRADPLTAELPFVFLTARADRADIREGMNLGANDYLTKPFQREELLTLVRAQLGRARQRSEATRTLQQEAQRLRHFDAVTGLPNRQWLIERLPTALQAAERNGTRIALVSIGFNGLDEIRASYGQQLGDAVLRQLANRLFEQIPRGSEGSGRDVVVRTRDARFGVLLCGMGAAAAVERRARSLLEELARGVQIDGGTLFVAPAAGISLYPDDAADADALLQHAEAAQPQGNPLGALRFHSPDLDRHMGRRVSLLQALHGALERNQFHLLYQPKVDLLSRRVVGFEALVRWTHPEFGLVSPAEFVPLAEESGLVVPIGAWVLRQAAAQTRAWLDAGHTGICTAVNLSSRQFDEDDLPRLVAATLDVFKLPPSALELEITESIALNSVERTLATLNALKALGVSLAMDDFGTGYSSLAYLKRYPLDALKVDQVFIRNMCSDPGDAAITRAVVALAHSFGLTVVAEGVESEAHVDFLRPLGCETFQGYLFARPLAAEDAEALLRRQRSEQAAAASATAVSSEPS